MFLINIRLNKYVIKQFKKNQEMYNKAINNYPHALEFVSKCYKSQKICDKAVNTYPSTTKFVSECVMTQDNT